MKKMPIREESFRIGCGRYLQKRGIIASLGDEVRRLGTAPLIVGGKTALSVARSAMESGLSNDMLYEIIEYGGTCNKQRAEELAEYAAQHGLDVIVGVGGGVLMDFAKLIAYYAKRPIINIPTSSATCAAYTPLSVCYTEEGRTVGTQHFEKEVDAVLADTDVLAAQPPRLFLAGVFDTLAKFLEIKHRFREDATDYPLGLDWAYLLSKKSFEELTAKAAVALADMQAGTVTPAVEQTLFVTIAVTGVISGIARGSNQTALAHKFYETARTIYHENAKPYLHGEIVGVGLLLQNHFNGEEYNNDFLLQLMQTYDMPSCVATVGVAASADALEEFYDRICGSSAIDKDDAAECKRFKDSLGYLWELNDKE